jgi:hypothetical protein
MWPGALPPLSQHRITSIVSSTQHFSRFIVEETEKWGKVVKFLGAKPE